MGEKRWRKEQGRGRDTADQQGMQSGRGFAGIAGLLPPTLGTLPLGASWSWWTWTATVGTRADIKALMDAAGSGSLDSLAGRLPDLRHHAALLTSLAAAAYGNTIKVPE